VNRFVAAALFLLCAAVPLRSPAVDVLTYHNDNLRSGWNNAETSLTPAKVGGGSLKPLFTKDIQGLIYGQPLIATAEQTSSGSEDLVYVATDRDAVNAFDAHTGKLVWTRSLIPSGETIVTTAFTGCINMLHAGISGTPVIDRTRDALYVVAETLTAAGSQQHIRFRLYSLALGTGALKGAPRLVSAEVHGKHGPITFLGDYQQQRSALVLANNRVYVGFGSTCDFNGDKYHGWLFSYDPDSLKPLSVFMDTPSSDDNGNYMGGIWMSGNGSAVDAHGNLMMVIGNGTFDGSTSFGDSAIKLAPDLSRVTDFFTPYTYKSDNNSDADFGSGGMLLFPDVAGMPSLAFGQGKDGILTMMDQQQLGRFNPGGPDHVLGELTLGSTWSSPAYFRGPNAEFIFTTGGPLYAIQVTRKPAKMHVVAHSNEQFQMNNGNGETPAISSNGSDPSSAIVWIVEWDTNNQLHLLAYAETDLSHTIFDAPLGPWRFRQTNSIQVPTIANGTVYVAGYDRLFAFSLNGK
jgi:outer membrane protein assembly factor BamB